MSVGEVLDEPEKYHLAVGLDPLEPDYQNYKTVSILYLKGGVPKLYSQAHGGRAYILLRQPRMIELKKGRTSEAMHEVLAALRSMPDVFDKDSLLVSVSEGIERVIQDAPALTFYLASYFQFYSWCGRSKEPTKILKAPPEAITKQLLSIGAQRSLKELKAVISSPLLKADGNVLNRTGYDHDTKLFLNSSIESLKLDDAVDTQSLKAALATIWTPFKHFPFVGDVDRSVMLASIFTAIQRPAMPTAPAIGFDAPVQGSGKTLLARAIGQLCLGKEPSIWPDVSGNGDEEIRKRLLFMLKSGERYIIWDNVLGVFYPKALASFLTSETFQDRQLGTSNHLSLPNRVFLTLTGNNLTLGGDMCRRVLRCRIDPQSDSPHVRSFDFSPVQFVRDNREEIIAAALTLMGAFKKQSARAPGSLASFEDWDEMVRQPIVWLASLFPEERLCDSVKAIDDVQSEDPEKAAFTEFMERVLSIFENREFTANELSRLIELPEMVEQSLMSVWGTLVGEKTSTRSIGKQLSFRKNRVVDGMRLVCCGKDPSTKVIKWRVERLSA